MLSRLSEAGARCAAATDFHQRLWFSIHRPLLLHLDCPFLGNDPLDADPIYSCIPRCKIGS